jgi:hypothetical protein
MYRDDLHSRLTMPKISSKDQTAPPTTLATVAPAWWEAVQRHAELSARRDALADEVAGLHEQIDVELTLSQSANNPRSLPADRVPPPKPQKRMSDRARAYLGLPPAPVAPAPVEPPAAPVFRHQDNRVERMRQIGAEIEAIDEALAELAKVIEREHAAGSKVFAAAIDSEVQAIAKQATDALIALGNAMVAARNLTAQHASANLGFARMIPLSILELGNPADRGSRIRTALAIAAEFGRFDAASIPATWREPAPANLTAINQAPRPPRKRHVARIKVPAGAAHAGIVPDSND